MSRETLRRLRLSQYDAKDRAINSGGQGSVTNITQADPRSEGERFMPSTKDMEALSVGDGNAFTGTLSAVGTPVISAGHKAVSRVHLLAKNPGGKVRTDELVEVMVLRLMHYCIPRRRIREAREYEERTGDDARLAKLRDEAKSLFVEQGMTGEPGELLLYLLQEHVLKIPQILCKMNLKTSANMHVHGSDGLHATLTENGDLALYWGESKIHATLDGALSSALKSLHPYLTGSRQDLISRDISLIRDHLNIDDEKLAISIFRYFADETEESARVEFRAACVIGFELAEYPDSPRAGEEVPEDLLAQIKDWVNVVDKRMKGSVLSAFHIDIFLIPLDSAQGFRDSFLSRIGLKTSIEKAADEASALKMKELEETQKRLEAELASLRESVRNTHEQDQIESAE